MVFRQVEMHMALLFCSVCGFNSFQNDNISDYSKLKEFADDNFRVHKNGIKFSKWVENSVGKGEIARYEQFLLFPRCLKKLVLKTRKNHGLFGKGLTPFYA